jgi:hypothetical protein
MILTEIAGLLDCWKRFPVLEKLFSRNGELSVLSILDLASYSKQLNEYLSSNIIQNNDKNINEPIIHSKFDTTLTSYFGFPDPIYHFFFFFTFDFKCTQWMLLQKHLYDVVLFLLFFWCDCSRKTKVASQGSVKLG